jgi:hypothetical protein
MIRNYSREIFFYYLTEDDGTYEINVGTHGNFFIMVEGPSHHWEMKEISISMFEEKVMDFQIERYEHNFMFFYYNQDEIYPIEDLEVQITDEADITKVYFTGDDGWVNLTLEPGNYSIITVNDLFQIYEDDFSIPENEVYIGIRNLYVANVDESASRSISDVIITIPPKSFRAVKLSSSEPTSLYLSASGNEKTTIIEMTQMMYDKYIEYHTGAPYPHDEPPIIEYDSKIGPTYGGGGSVAMWRIPYYIIFENNNSVSAEVDFDLYYEYGDPVIVDIEEGPLSSVIREDDDESDGSSDSSFVSLGTAILSMALFTLTFVMLKRRISEG